MISANIVSGAPLATSSALATASGSGPTAPISTVAIPVPTVATPLPAAATPLPAAAAATPTAPQTPATNTAASYGSGHFTSSGKYSQPQLYSLLLMLQQLGISPHPPAQSVRPLLPAPRTFTLTLTTMRTAHSPADLFVQLVAHTMPSGLRALPGTLSRLDAQ